LNTIRIVCPQLQGDLEHNAYSECRIGILLQEDASNLIKRNRTQPPFFHPRQELHLPSQQRHPAATRLAQSPPPIHPLVQNIFAATALAINVREAAASHQAQSPQDNAKSRLKRPRHARDRQEELGLLSMRASARQSTRRRRSPTSPTCSSRETENVATTRRRR